MACHFKLTVFILMGCHIVPFQATSRALSFVHRPKESHHKRQIDNQFTWETSWRSETTDAVTTITSATVGSAPPGQAIFQATASIWTYTYSYSGSSINNNTSGSGISSLDSSNSKTSSPPSDYGPSNVTQNTNSAPLSLESVDPDSPPPKPSSSGPPSLGTIGPSNTAQPESPAESQGPPDQSESSPDSPDSLDQANSPPPTSTVTENSGNSDNPAQASRPPTSEALNPLSSVENAKKFVTQAGDVNDWLGMHNTYRSDYGSPQLEWNSTLAEQAKRVATTCRWEHTMGNSAGENIAAGQETPSDVVQAWVEGQDERDGYDPQVQAYTHFTQVVWKDTTSVGCWAITCVKIEGTALPQSPVKFFVCEYHPKGNIVGSFTENVRAGKGGQPLQGSSPNRSDNPNGSSYVEAPTGTPPSGAPPGE